MPIDLTALLADLAAESAALDEMIAPLGQPEYLLPTPAEGWCIADQVSHLAYFDEAALGAVTDADRFRADSAGLLAAGAEFPDQIAVRYRTTPGAELRTWLTGTRRELIDALAAIGPSVRLPWYGPDMSAASMATARLMETWAHGQDIADALAVTRPVTGRLRHVAHIGAGTIGFSFAVRGLPVPDEPVRIELTGPDGDQWAFGPAGAANLVRAPALDFCLLVTQRRNRADTAVRASGPVAAQWLSIAQAFAGPPGQGRPPGAGIPASSEGSAS